MASRTLRDWLFLTRNALPGMFSLHSSLDATIEAVRVLRRNHPKADGAITAGLLAHLRDNLDELHEDFLGDVEFEGADLDDHHVHAAAMSCGAQYLVTDNARDFGDPDGLPYEIYSADEFLCLIDDGAAHKVREVTRIQNAYWQSRRVGGQSVKVLDQALVDAGCPMFAERVRGHLKVLAGV